MPRQILTLVFKRFSKKILIPIYHYDDSHFIIIKQIVLYIMNDLIKINIILIILLKMVTYPFSPVSLPSLSSPPRSSFFTSWLFYIVTLHLFAVESVSQCLPEGIFSILFLSPFLETLLLHPGHFNIF